MKGDIPELRELRRELRRRGVAPEALSHELGWTGQQRVFQHIDGRAELPPQSGAKCRLHQVFSHYALLLFSSFLDMLPQKWAQVSVTLHTAYRTCCECPMTSACVSRILTWSRITAHAKTALSAFSLDLSPFPLRKRH